MEALLSSQLLDASGNTVPTSSVLGGVVGLYFSAHWCPPCRAFTPALSAWYKSFVERNPDKKFSIVFVSSDRSESDFTAYHKEMTFHALPFSEREKKADLSSKFGVRGIPTLIFLDENGEILTKDGRSIVNDDPEGASEFWGSWVVGWLFVCLVFFRSFAGHACSLGFSRPLPQVRSS
jgi:nucleoredoxin